jgi:electron transfer flavoprotein alpha subunit
VLGRAVHELAAEMATKKLAKVYAVEHAQLEQYTADGYTLAVEQLVKLAEAAYVVMPHTYQVRDFAPAVATRCGQVLISDVIAIGGESSADGLVFVRQLLQGKLNADYRKTGDGPCFVSVQAGTFRADAVEEGSATLETFVPDIEEGKIRNKPGELFRESTQTVDLTVAPVIVSVGRGIGEQENIEIVEELATALGAELAASRPICDNGWLPMERQVGSSGQTVSPKLYLAVGISGAIQHLVGMKGSKTVIAINKDENAPIFEVADYGVVGDLFEIVPALTKAVLEAKG